MGMDRTVIIDHTNTKINEDVKQREERQREEQSARVGASLLIVFFFLLILWLYVLQRSEFADLSIIATVPRPLPS